jgi:predicted AAA+ superfamily ATPase
MQSLILAENHGLHSLPDYPHLTGISTKKIKQLLTFIANSVPFTPNWTKIAKLLEIGDVRTLKTYFSHLEDARLVKTISNASQKLSQLEVDLLPAFTLAQSEKDNLNDYI